MNINSLRYFIVLANELHFSHAAQRLHISQPPLSRAIQQLEEELEVQLFERDREKVELTPSGEYLKLQAEKIFSILSETESRVKRIAEGEEGNLHVTYVGSVYHLIGPAIINFSRKFPKVQLKISQYTTWEQLQLLKAGIADIAFVRSPVSAGNLKVKEIGREDFILIAPEGFSKKIDSLEELPQLSDHPFILFPRHLGSSLFDQVIALCNRSGFSPNIMHEASQLRTIVRMVESGLGCSVLPRSSLIGIQSKVQVFPLDFRPQKAILSLCYNPAVPNKVRQNFLDQEG